MAQRPNLAALAPLGSPACGLIAFPQLTFYEPGDYIYVVRELPSHNSSWIADDTLFRVVIHVVDVGGALVAESEFPDGQPLFINTYIEQKVEVKFDAYVRVDGGKLLNYEFEYGLFDSDGNLVSKFTNSSEDDQRQKPKPPLEVDPHLATPIPKDEEREMQSKAIESYNSGNKDGRNSVCDGVVGRDCWPPPIVEENGYIMTTPLNLTKPGEYTFFLRELTKVPDNWESGSLQFRIVVVVIKVGDELVACIRYPDGCPVFTHYVRDTATPSRPCCPSRGRLRCRPRPTCPPCMPCRNARALNNLPKCPTWGSGDSRPNSKCRPCLGGKTCVIYRPSSGAPSFPNCPRRP